MVRGELERATGSDAIDVQQFHVWSDEWVKRGDWLEAVQKLKEQGKRRFFGVSINDFQPDNVIKLIETGAVDTVQVIYNIFEQSKPSSSTLTLIVSCFGIPGGQRCDVPEAFDRLWDPAGTLRTPHGNFSLEWRWPRAQIQREKERQTCHRPLPQHLPKVPAPKLS